MKNKVTRRILSLILSMVLIVAMALTATGCGNNGKNGEDTQKEMPQGGDKNESQNDMTGGSEDNSKDDSELETGSENDTQKNAYSFKFVVVDADGNETSFDIKTDEKTVGAALLEQELIKGEEGQYGLYVTEVNGITADYEKDGTYWAFYINGEYAMTGIDLTKIEDGATYSLKVEKG